MADSALALGAVKLCRNRTGIEPQPRLGAVAELDCSQAALVGVDPFGADPQALGHLRDRQQPGLGIAAAGIVLDDEFEHTPGDGIDQLGIQPSRIIATPGTDADSVSRVHMRRPTVWLGRLVRG